MNENQIDNKIIRLIDLLKFEGKIKTMDDFYKSVEISRASLSKIRNGYGNHFTVSHIENICKTFKVNANWIFGLEEEIFINKKR